MTQTQSAPQRRIGAIAPMLIFSLIGFAGAGSALGQSEEGGTGFGLWEPFAPPQNPVTEEKRVLGKILFWDEQLSSDNTVSCGSCHIPSEGGVDPRIGVNPSYDGIFGTADDVAGSPGVIATDEDGRYLRSVLFDLLPQTTPRRSMTNLVAMYSGNLFWDGRAEGALIDPLTGETAALSSAGLEIQSLAPIMSDVEMAHTGRTWGEVTGKIAGAKPMALGSDLPQDMAEAIAAHPSYPELFEQAFGDPEVTPVRMAFAMATYQRTLVPDQSPWDLWNLGDESAMSQQQKDGWFLFKGSACNNCHVAPLFTTNTFTVDGVRPVVEDRGRAEINGFNSDRGAFKMSTLRNIGTRDRFMHTGGLTSMEDVFDFYAHRNGSGPNFENLDGRVSNPIVFSPANQAKVKHFLTTALTDPRVSAGAYPFDRPTLHAELDEPNPLVGGGGSAGAGGFTPQMIAVTPPNMGNTGFKIGVDFALGGAQAYVTISTSAPVGGIVANDEVIGPIELGGMSPGDGFGTLIYPIDDPALADETFYMQWMIADPAAAGGYARSPIAAVTPFCTMYASCAPACPADINDDGELNFFDVSGFLSAFNTQDDRADFDGNGSFNFFDVSGFLTSFGDGCP